MRDPGSRSVLVAQAGDSPRVAATRWADGTLTDEELVQNIAETCGSQALHPPKGLTSARVHEVRITLDVLCGRWIELLPKGALNAQFNPANPESTFQSLRL